MTHFLLYRLILLCLVLFTLPVYGDVIELKSSNQAFHIGPHLEYLVTDFDQYSIHDVVNASHAYRRLNTRAFSSGPEVNHYWFRASVVNRLDSEEFWLFMENVASYADVYIVNSRGTVLSQVVNGALVPQSERPIDNPNPIFPVQLPRGEFLNIYINIRCEHVVRSVFILGSPKAVLKEQNPRYFMAAALSVLVVFMAFYNFVIYIVIRDRLYLYYVLYVVCGSSGHLVLIGGWNLFFSSYPPHPLLLLFFHGMGLWTLILFCLSFLAPVKGSWPYRVFIGFLVLTMLATMIPLLMGKQDVSFILIVFMLFAPWVFSYGIFKAWQGSLSARLFVLGWLIYLVSFLLLCFEILGVVQPREWGLFMSPLGQMVEMILFAAALAFRVRELIQDRDNLQSERAEVLEKAKSSLEQSNRSKDHFLSMITHELRTPLHGIVGNMELLLDRMHNSGNRHLVQASLQSANRLNRVVEGILDFTELQQQNVEFRPENLSLENFVHQLAADYSSHCCSNLDFDVVLDPALPKWVVMDGVLVCKVIRQLLDNAFKFTQQGKVQLSVGVQSQTESVVRLEFKVLDTGPGIPDQEKRRIFEPFQQLESGLTRRFGGVGMGLPLALHLATLQDAELRLLSSTSAGSCFCLELSVRKGSMPHASIKSIHANGGTGPTAIKPHVLVVEDDATNRLVMRKMLETLHVRVTMVDDGQQALNHIEDQNWGLVLMDCQMPVIDGLEATKLIRSLGGRFATVPIVAISADTATSNQQRCIEAGMNGFLAKPLRMDSLRDLLRDQGILSND